MEKGLGRSERVGSAMGKMMKDTASLEISAAMLGESGCQVVRMSWLDNCAFTRLWPRNYPDQAGYPVSRRAHGTVSSVTRRLVLARDLPRFLQIFCFKNHDPIAGTSKSFSRGRPTVLHVLRKQLYLSTFGRCAVS